MSEIVAMLPEQIIDEFVSFYINILHSNVL